MVKITQNSNQKLTEIILDPNAVLTNDTLLWCKEAMLVVDHPSDPVASEFLSQVRHFLIPAWYCQLRVYTRNHIESGENPILALAPKSDISKEWQVRQQILAEMRNEVDTFDLIESGNLIHGQKNDLSSDYTSNDANDD